MDMELWFAFMVACWLIALSPGSGAILAISHGSVYGVRRTSATIAGRSWRLIERTSIAASFQHQQQAVA